MFHMTQLGPGLGSTDHLTSSNVESMEYGFVVYDNPNHVTVSSSTSVYRRPRSKFCIGLITFGIVIVITSVALGFIIHYAVNSDRQVSPSSSTSNVQSHDYKPTDDIKRIDFEGRIRITSLKWMPDLGNHAKELYRVVTNHIQKELNHVFEIGPLVERYNRTVVVDLSPGSVIVDFIVVLNSRRGIDTDSLKAMMLQGLEKRSKFIRKLKSNHMPASKIVFDKRSLEIADSHNPDIKAETKYLPKPKILPEIREFTTTSQTPHSNTFTSVSSTTKTSKKKKKRPTTTPFIPSTTELENEITLPSTNTAESTTTSSQQITKKRVPTTLSTTTKPSTRKQKDTDAKATVTSTPLTTLPNAESTAISTTPLIISKKDRKPTTKTKMENTSRLEKPYKQNKSGHPSHNESVDHHDAHRINGSLQNDHHHYDYNDSRGNTHHHIHQGIQNASHHHHDGNSSSVDYLNNQYHSLDYTKQNHSRNESHIESHEQNHEHSHNQTIYHNHQNGVHNLSHSEGFHNFSDYDDHSHVADTHHSLHKEVNSHHHHRGSNDSHSEVHHAIQNKDGDGHPEKNNLSVDQKFNQSVFWSTNEDDPKSFINKSFDGHLTAIDDPPDRITDLNDTDAEEVPYLNSFGATDFAVDGRETATLPNTVKEHVPQLTDLEQSDNHIPPHEPYSQNSRDKLENSIEDSMERSKPMEYDRILANMNRNTARSQHHESSMVDPEELAKESPPFAETFENYWPHGNMNRPFSFPNRMSTPYPVMRHTELPQTTKEMKETADETPFDDLETGSGELTETFEDLITVPPSTTTKVIPHIRDIKRPSFETPEDHQFLDSILGENQFPNSIFPHENHGETEDTPALVPKSEQMDFSRHHREEIQEDHIEHGEMEEPLFNLHHLEYARTREPGKEYFDHPSHFHDQPQDLTENVLNITSSEEDIVPDLLAEHLDQREHESMLLNKNETNILAHPLPISAAAGADFPMNTKDDIPALEQNNKKTGQSKKGQEVMEARDRRDGSEVPDFIGHPVGGMSHLGPSNFMPFPPAADTASGKEDLNEENELDMDSDSNLGPSNFMPLPPQSSLPKDHKAVLPHDVTPPKVYVPKDGEGVLTPPPLIHKPGIITHVLSKNKKKVNEDKEEHAHSKTHVSSKIKNKSTHRSDKELKSSANETRLNLKNKPDTESRSNGSKYSESNHTHESQNATKGLDVLTRSVDYRENSTSSEELNDSSTFENRLDSIWLAPMTTPFNTATSSNTTSHNTRHRYLENIQPNATNDFRNLTETNEENVHTIQLTNTTLIEPHVDLNNTIYNGVNVTETTIGSIGYNPCQDNDIVLQYLNNCRSYFFQIIKTDHDKARCMHLLNGIMCLTGSIYEKYNVRCTDTDVEHVIKLNSQSIQQFFPSFDPNQCLN